jgi:hypothetical protein
VAVKNVGKAERRLAWIEACLRLSGRFGIKEKKAYRDRFGLTDGMVSRDQGAFIRLLHARCGHNIVVKFRGKLSIGDGATLPAAPVFLPQPKTTDWLEELLGEHYEVVEPIQRAEPATWVLREIAQAISDKRTLRLRYHSRHRDASDRVVSPHTIVHVAGRLHVRAWDHGPNAPRDLVLTRISAIARAEELQEYVGPEHDRDWHERVVLQIRLRGGESLDAVGPDYGLDPSGNSMRIVRMAHAAYLIDNDGPDRDRPLLSPVSVKALSKV